ncbi:MAG TPA: N-acetyl-gamma-glutamyl-phosphate reductase, partial [Bacteroidia bacterium]|nr:N-acetyl-gamma-glutamyl-phosphate reductase [Bacteroidia bacterium]
MQTIKTGIIGGAGYTGGELLRLLLLHPNAEVSYIVSKSQAGKPVSQIHTDLTGDTDLVFTEKPNKHADVVFLCMAHGEAKKFLEENEFLFNAKVIDLSKDLRIESKQLVPGKNFVYGLPELNKDKIKKANYIANPGCFATAIQLGLLPLAGKGLLTGNININATTGSTGAGQSLSSSTHFSWRNNNLSVYKPFEHEHLAEI